MFPCEFIVLILREWYFTQFPKHYVSLTHRLSGSGFFLCFMAGSYAINMFFHVQYIVQCVYQTGYKDLTSYKFSYERLMVSIFPMR